MIKNKQSYGYHQYCSTTLLTMIILIPYSPKPINLALAGATIGDSTVWSRLDDQGLRSKVHLMAAAGYLARRYIYNSSPEEMNPEHMACAIFPAPQKPIFKDDKLFSVAIFTFMQYALR